MLRLIQIIPYLGFGGLERVATTLTLELAARGERVLVCSSGGEPYQSELRAAGVPVELVPRPWGRPVPLVRSAFALARVLRRERPDVVHAHNPAASAAAALARSLARTRETAIVTTYHGVIEQRLGRATRALALSADLVVGVSPTSTHALHAAGYPADRTITILNAVEPRVSRSADDVRREFGAESAPFVVTVGRYFPEKNQALLLDALATLAGEGRLLKALVVGYGPLEAELRARAAALGIAERVTFTGRRDDAADLIAAADVFVLSSDSEALPLVLLEAMSLGTPVVTTDAGGIRDLVEDGERGIVVPVGDAAALAAALSRVLDDAALRTRLARSAEEFVREHCSVQAMVASYRTAYADAARRRSGRSE